MRNHIVIAFALGGVLGAAVPACGLDVPDLNNPSLDDLKNHPDAITIGAACTGLLIGNRGNHASENGYVTQLGILGREAYNFDAADPRYVGELLVGKLNRGSPFGGNFWAGPYANIQLGNILLHALDKTADLDDMQKAAIRGFTKTMQALDLLTVIITHDTNGAVIDTDHDALAPLGAIVGPAVVYPKIIELLESGNTDLAAGGTSFPFALSKGFDGFSTPATFAKFNRAIRARVAAYGIPTQPNLPNTPDYPTVLTALAASFINDTPATLNFDAGVYYAYSTKPEDTASALINPNIYVHPSVQTDAMKNAAGVIDARLLRKIAPASPGRRGTTMSFKGLYPNPETSVSLIRNEELILLKAEALYFTGLTAEGIAELNIVRTQSGRLEPVAPADDAAFLSALLYERRYSLLFEGHRWIDARRLGRLADLPIFVTVSTDGTKMTPDTLNVRYPIPLGECNARPGEPACMLGSTN